MAAVDGPDVEARSAASVLAIGTATPLSCIDQSLFPDYYFRVTNSEHKTELKQKFVRMCEKSTIKNRYTCLTEETLKENPNICQYNTPSFNTRQDIAVAEVPKLGKEAAQKAIKEWGQPKSKITHLIFCTNSGMDMPGADYQLVKLLGLELSVKRCMLYQLGCYGGGTVLRMAKDLAENNVGSRVLAVCSELSSLAFCGPSDENHDILVGQALFGDGAGAVIVGSDPIPGVEKPVFQLVSASQTILPDTGDIIYGHYREEGLVFHMGREIPGLISENVEEVLKEAYDPFGISDWNSIFWVVHPGGPTILNQVEAKLALKPNKFQPTRNVLSEYGNMSSTSVLFVLDEMRTGSAKAGLSSTGEGLDWGVLLSFGPGITVETMVLRSVPIN